MNTERGKSDDRYQDGSFILLPPLPAEKDAL